MKPAMQVVVVKNIARGIERAKEELYEHVDGKSVLFLSGGKTPKSLYEILAKEKIIKPAAAALVDERFGKKMHKNSNEKMISDTGLLKYFQERNIPFYSVLQSDNNRQKTANVYDETVRNLFFHFPKSIGILGIGKDGHTAGIPAQKSKAGNVKHDEKNLQLDASVYTTHDFVTSYNDSIGKYKERITLTFAGLSLLDFIIVLAFGKDKKEALQKTFEPGSMEEIPARFFQKNGIAKKTLFITDQKI